MRQNPGNQKIEDGEDELNVSAKASEGLSGLSRIGKRHQS